MARTKISRDKHSKDIDRALCSEGPARLTRQLHKLLKGLCALSNVLVPNSEHWAILAKIAGDSMPGARLELLRILANGPQKAPEIQACVACGPSTLYRRLQDLEALGMAQQKEKGVWSLTDKYGQYCHETGVVHGKVRCD